MGFVLKSTFWLGLVFSAMPLGEQGQNLLTPAEQASACATATAAISDRVGSGADPYRALALLGCSSLASHVAAATPTPTPAPAAPLLRQTLNSNDRRAPWLGPPSPPSRPKSV